MLHERGELLVRSVTQRSTGDATGARSRWNLPMAQVEAMVS
jgi:hypothetical protein